MLSDALEIGGWIKVASTEMKKLIFPGRKSKSSPKKRFWLANKGGANAANAPLPKVQTQSRPTP